MIIGHGGNIRETAERFGLETSEIVDMSSNVNPLGPPKGLLELLKSQIDLVKALPESDARKICHGFARRYAIKPENVLAGNGTTQFIYSIPEVLEIRKALILGPTYSDYADACAMRKTPFSFVMAKDSDDFHHDPDLVETQIGKADAVFICNPNNPTGTLFPRTRINGWVRKFPHTFFIIDESYLPFARGGESESLMNSIGENVLVLHSLSKIFRIPGLRIGFVIAKQRIIQKFRSYYLPWSVNSLAQAAVEYLLNESDQAQQFIHNSQNYLEKERYEFENGMKKSAKIKIFKSNASFLLAKLTCGLRSEEAFEKMARSGFLIRDCENFEGLSEKFIRISLKTNEVNRRAAQKLLEILEPCRSRSKTCQHFG